MKEYGLEVRAPTGHRSAGDKALGVVRGNGSPHDNHDITTHALSHKSGLPLYTYSGKFSLRSRSMSYREY